MVESGMIYQGMSTARAIKTARKAAGLSQYDLAAKLNYSQGTIANWERGAREPPVATFMKILEICKGFEDAVCEDLATEDIQFSELVTLWKELNTKQKREVLNTARRLRLSEQFSNV